MTPIVSIVIATRNRYQSLHETLASLGRLSVPSTLPTELLIVDNGSTDETPQVAAAAQRHLPFPTRYLFEARKGRSNACNSGVAAAKGAIILFTDDDLRFPSDWVQRMAEPIFHARADIVQGGIKPAPFLQRDWLTHSFVAISAAMDLALPPAVPPQLVGANFSASRAVFETVKGFDPVFGTGGITGSGEDTLFGFMAKQAGFNAVFADDCYVEHHFDITRLEAPNVIAAAKKLGMTFAYFDYHWRHDDAKASSMKWLLLRLKLALRKNLPAKAPGPIPEWRFCYERDIEYQRQMRLLRGTPRRYAKNAVTARLEP